MLKIIQKRQFLIDDIFHFRLANAMVLVTGLRRSGKSELLISIMQKLRIEQPPVKIIYIKPEFKDYPGISLVREARALGVGPSALIVDNADYIKGLKEAISEIKRRYKSWILISGKHSYSLIKELTPLFSPSILNIPPFKYVEYLEFRSFNPNQLHLKQYALHGGMPENLHCIHNEQLSNQYRKFFVHSFLLTEILDRGTIRNTTVLRTILRTCIQHSGEIVSARNISALVAKEKISISPQTAIDYVRELVDSGFLIEINLYDISNRKIMDTGKVYYCADTGLRSSLLTSYEKNSSKESDKLIENLVFLHLYHTYPKIYRGRVNIDSTTKEEISFICEGKEGRVYFQYIAQNSSVSLYYQRKKALLAIHDGWKKICIANEDNLDEHGLHIITPQSLLV